MALTQIEQQILLDFIRTEKLSIKTRKGWKNFAHNVNEPKALVCQIQDINTLQKFIKKIYAMNSTKPAKERIIVRPAAGGKKQDYSESFSFTTCAEGDVILNLVGDVFRTVEPTAQEDVMKVGASTQVGDLDQLLYDKFNCVLPTASLIPYVTVAGLSANAGHGTGADQPSFAGLIRAMTFCLPNGEIVRIDDKTEDFPIIRGAHLGLFGIVLNVEIECRKAEKLQCSMEVMSLPEALQHIKQGCFKDPEYPYACLMYVPTYQGNAELTNHAIKNVIVYRFKPVDRNTPDTPNIKSVIHLIQETQVKMADIFRVTDLLKLEPWLTPYYMRYVLATMTVGLFNIKAVGDWPRIMHYQTAFPRGINDTSWLFNVSQNQDEIVDAFKKQVAVLNACAEKGVYPQLYPSYARCFQGTNGGLSTSCHHPGNTVCGFDIISSPNTPGYEEYREAMCRYFYKDLSAKPHWGKYVPPTLDFHNCYGEDFSKFEQTLLKWYSDHQMDLKQSMLLNTFACDVFNYEELRPERYPVQDVLAEPKGEIPTSRELAKKILASLQKETINDVHFYLFKKNLEAIANQSEPVHSNLTTFQPLIETQPVEEVKEEQKTNSNVCSIL